MLKFDPRKRISVVDALKHPWLAQLHDEAAEPCAPGERYADAPDSCQCWLPLMRAAMCLIAAVVPLWRDFKRLMPTCRAECCCSFVVVTSAQGRLSLTSMRLS